MAVVISFKRSSEAKLTDQERLQIIKRALSDSDSSMGEIKSGNRIIFLSKPDHYIVKVDDAQIMSYAVITSGASSKAQLEALKAGNTLVRAASCEYIFKIAKNGQLIEGVYNRRFIDPGRVDNFLKTVISETLGLFELHSA